MCEVKGNKEEFVSCADEEKRRLVGIHGEERVLNRTGRTHWVVVVEPEDAADIGSNEFVGF